MILKTPIFWLVTAPYAQWLALQKTKTAYHKFVKTTPNPRATKNNRGELVGPLLLPDAGWEGEGVGKVDVMVAMNDGDSESDDMWLVKGDHEERGRAARCI